LDIKKDEALKSYGSDVEQKETYQFDFHPNYVTLTKYNVDNKQFLLFIRYVGFYVTDKNNLYTEFHSDLNGNGFRKFSYPGQRTRGSYGVNSTECFIVPSKGDSRDDLTFLLETINQAGDTEHTRDDYGLFPFRNFSGKCDPNDWPGHMSFQDAYDDVEAHFGVEELGDYAGKPGDILKLKDYLVENGEEDLVKRVSENENEYYKVPLLEEYIMIFDDDEDKTEYYFSSPRPGSLTEAGVPNSRVGYKEANKCMFWLRDNSYIGRHGRDTIDKIVKDIKKKLTLKTQMDNRDDDFRNSVNDALSKTTETGESLPPEMKDLIMGFGGKKKRKSLKKKRKTKRKTKRKSLKKKRKTKKIKNRGAGGPFSSIFSKKKPLDTFGRESSAVRDPTEEEEYPFEDAHRWRFDPRKYAEPRWESDEQRFVRLDNRDREFGHGPYINSKNEIVPAPSKRHYATQANIDLANAYMKNKNEIKHKKNVEHNKHVVTNPLHEGGKTKRKGRR
jgi:hypothetical protein